MRNYSEQLRIPYSRLHRIFGLSSTILALFCSVLSGGVAGLAVEETMASLTVEQIRNLSLEKMWTGTKKLDPTPLPN
jgi:hypothetical protein